MSDLVLVTYTGEHAAGGVPRWVRDFKHGFPEAKSYSWNDMLEVDFDVATLEVPEWDKARTLNRYLRFTEKIKDDDIVIVDGFWGIGLEDMQNVVSVCHGIWSHLIKEEADAGKEPDFPFHHAMQVEYRRKHLERGGRLVAVSKFIQHQMMLQWGFESVVINNGIDLDQYAPTNRSHGLDKPLVIHGVNDKGNPVKGWDHIEHLKKNLDAYVWSLDEAWSHLQHRSDMFATDPLTKYEALAMADCVVIPSAYEGNSYFALEALACDVPIATYDVGLFWELSPYNSLYVKPQYSVGCIKTRTYRHPSRTVDAVLSVLDDDGMFPPWSMDIKWKKRQPRRVAELFSIQNFHENWRAYLKEEFDYCSP